MTRACVPSMSPHSSNNHAHSNGIDMSSVTLSNSTSFYKLIEESRWLYQVFRSKFCFRILFDNFCVLVTKNLAC